MAKRKTSSRKSGRNSPKAARSIGARPANNPALEQVISAEAVYELAASNPAETAGDAAKSIEGHVAAPDQEPTRVQREGHAKDLLVCVEVLRGGFRNAIERHLDYPSQPFMRVVGRVVHVLTCARAWPSCTGVEVFRVFLDEVPGHLPKGFRQTPRAGEEPDATEPIGLRTVYKRLDRLVEQGFAKTTKTTKDQKHGQYVMTYIGELVFDEWPTDVLLDERPTPRDRPRKKSIYRVPASRKK